MGKYLRKSDTKGWYWTPFTYCFGAGGWFYLSARWLWRQNPVKQFKHTDRRFGLLWRVKSLLGAN